jgi:TIR domain
MALSRKSAEIQRLLKAFEDEASKFHDLRLSTYYVTQSRPKLERKFASHHHAIMLWQYYGLVETGQDIEGFLANLQESNLRWGLRGAELTSFAVLEGPACDLFVRMAQRAGSLFDESEARMIKARVICEIFESLCTEASPAKPNAVMNNNPLAVWLNYLLYHLSMTNPGREQMEKIEPDPFTLSLLALERLLEDQAIGKVDRSARKIADLKFKVALSFPGEQRAYVADVVGALRPHLGPDSIFYDHDYQAQLSRPNLDSLLQNVYRSQSELVVVFLCAEYARKEWCGLEWRAIRDIIKSKRDDQVMFVRFDDSPVDGFFSVDGYVDANVFDPLDVARFILERIGHSSELR